MASKHTFGLYELVRVRGRGETQPSAIREADWSPELGEYAYTVVDREGRRERLPGSELEATGRFEAPFRYYEVVQIFPEDPGQECPPGAMGVVMGVSENEGTGGWLFAVSLQSGEVRMFAGQELRPTGRLVPLAAREARYAGNKVRIRVDPESGVGHVPPGDKPVRLHKYTPWPMDLSRLDVMEDLEEPG